MDVSCAAAVSVQSAVQCVQTGFDGFNAQVCVGAVRVRVGGGSFVRFIEVREGC
jgi:hypothetical protein